VSAVVAAANAIVTLGDVKGYLKIGELNPEDNDWLQQQINWASNAIEGYVRGPVKQVTITDEIYDGNGTSRIITESKPVIELATNKVEDVMWRAAPDFDWIVLEPTLKHILIKKSEPYAIHLWANVFAIGVQNIKLCYKAGYAVIPGDISLTAIEMVAEPYMESRRSGIGRLGQRSKSTMTGGVSGSDTYYELSKRHQAALAQYVWYMP
jgi:hypothetical protein